MQDRTYQQAIEDLRDRISDDFQSSVNHMLVHRTTATDATLNIQDEGVRTVVTDALIAGQILTLLTLMRDLCMVDEEQHREFTAYLLRSLTS
ncbi:hypothetical protein [Dictyobacter aurantiacus]|uniref:Uncharacterized protein n=1 Tax=Dictyobacter aurantiacus TaxID=1936993 RepID=A0A401ZIG5_9CHLR|nr:hypothetical protein [Dictyobacter aurantiacus]GCE06651.1 hypothetical protein KDAU_39800 [Dictyobacter aurantiacus]